MSIERVRELVVYGASGHGDALSKILAGSAMDWRTIAFIDDTPAKHGTKLSGVPVVSFEQWLTEFRDRSCFVAVGNGSARSTIVQRLTQAGAIFPRIHPAETTGSVPFRMGIGSVICTPGFVGSAVSVGDHVQIMPMVSLGHDVEIKSFATICPGATISGHVIIGEGAFLGAGCVVVNGSASKPLVIGAWATVYAGAVVTKQVPARAKVAGNPARPLRELATRRE
jgi:sugar O-acyltransferase (sialic acid O-acetyltransferase NeuD family)